MKNSDIFWALYDMDDDLIREAKEVSIMNAKQSKPLRIALIAAAVVVLLAGTALAVVHYTGNAERLEQAWNEMPGDDMSQTHKDFIEVRSCDLGETAEDQGISITVDSVTVTEDTIYYTYTMDLGSAAEHFSGYMNADYTAVLSDGTVCNGGQSVADLALGPDDPKQVLASIVAFDLPDGDTLSEGTLQIDISAVTVDDLRRIEGSWRFEISLPACRDSAHYDVDEPICFPDGAELTLSDLIVSEAKISFDYTANVPQVIILDGEGFDIDMVKAADPDVGTVYVFFAKLENGTSIPISGGGSSQDENGVNHAEFYWIAPIDITDVASIVFTDGETEIETAIQ